MLTLENLKSLFKALPISYVVTLPNVPDFSIADINEAFLKVTSCDASYFLGNPLFEVLPKLSQEMSGHSKKIKDRINDAVFSKKNCRLTLESWIIDIIPILDADNNLQYIVQTFEPMNHHKASNNFLQLRKEKKKYQNLFNFSPLPQWVYSITTLHFLDVNDAAVKHYGYTREEFLGMKITDIRPQEDITILKSITNTLEKGMYNRSTVRHQKKNGEIINVVVEGNSIQFQDQDARLVLAIDHTEKIKAEKALAASELRFKALIQEGSDLIAITDQDGYYRYVSPTSISILGIEGEFFTGKNVFDFIHAEDKSAVWQQYKQLKFHHRIRIEPFRFKVSDDQYRWIETIVTNMTDDPAIAGIVSNSRDVTRQIENELKMEESIARFGIVSKATSDAIWDLDILTGKATWNKGLKGIFGHNKTSYSYKWWRSQIHPDDVEEVVNKTQSLIENKESRLKLEYRFRCADGTYKYIQDRSFLLFDGEGEALRMIGSMQDITERVNYIKAMEQQNERLREISWMQSHHVRAPLARIMGLTSLLTDDKHNDAAETKEFLQHLTDSSAELDEIIKEIVRKTEGL